MTQRDKSKKEPTGVNTSPPVESDDYLKHILAYKDALEQVSNLLLTTSWEEFTFQSDISKTIIEELTKTILMLEKLVNDPKGNRFKISAIRDVLYQALDEFNQALDLAGARASQSRSSRFKNIINCRKQLTLAQQLMSDSSGKG